LLLVSVIVSLVVVKSLESKAIATIEKLDLEISKQRADISATTSSEVTGFQNGLLNLKTVLSKHVVLAEAINTIAKNTHQKVSFVNLKINYDDKQIQIEGIADSNMTIAEAGNVFSLIPSVSKVSFKTIKNLTDGIHFTMTMDVLESFFN